MYHFIVPLLVEAKSVNEEGSHAEDGVVPVIVGIGFISASTGVRTLLVHPFSTATIQYLVVAERVGVVNKLPVDNIVPPTESLYQSIVPLLAEAPKIKIPGPQFTLLLTEAIDGKAFMVAITAVRGFELHPFE